MTRTAREYVSGTINARLAPKFATVIQNRKLALTRFSGGATRSGPFTSWFCGPAAGPAVVGRTVVASTRTAREDLVSRLLYLRIALTPSSSEQCSGGAYQSWTVPSASRL